MKKATLKAIIEYLDGATVTNIAEIAEELKAEYARLDARAAENRVLYQTAHDIVMETLHGAGTDLTVAALYDLCEPLLPEGFSKSKLQYGLQNYWKDEVVKIENGHNEPYTYKIAT